MFNGTHFGVGTLEKVFERMAKCSVIALVGFIQAPLMGKHWRIGPCPDPICSELGHRNSLVVPMFRPSEVVRVKVRTTWEI